MSHTGHRGRRLPACLLRQTCLGTGSVLSSCAVAGCEIGPLCTSAAGPQGLSSTVTPAVRRLPAVLQECLWRLKALARYGSTCGPDDMHHAMIVQGCAGACAAPLFCPPLFCLCILRTGVLQLSAGLPPACCSEACCIACITVH